LSLYSLYRIEESLDAINQGIHINPHEDSYHYQQSTIFYYSNKYELAVDSIEKAIFIDPNDGEYWNFKGVILLDYSSELRGICDIAYNHLR
jgi:tetratricopeptide (TPR) repeat protein